ncbi:universal stress protein [Winogradskyella alexanderae]|uniref:Universal stress protein n=1 Tax=Winogradskyella alexanderae TaxID=2877123 RepID=A0ABS7XTM5_9FLAO|nr:universal stress protein [Winogradskyella alexanderae]MCA0133384.1 universal stress protein [Winogradskyella alexanderae]
MKKVLLPTDFSDNAMNSIVFALEFFKYDNCEFYFLHVYEDEVYNTHKLSESKSFDELKLMSSKKSSKNLESLLEKVSTIAPHKRFSYNIISAYNSLLDEANKVVIEKNIDLIVMGTKGEGANHAYAFGSNTLQVLKYVSCPVLVIPEAYEYTQPKKVLFPTNFLIPYKRRELKLLYTMLKPFRSIIDVIYIAKYSNLSRRQVDNKEFLKGEFEDLQINFVNADDKDISGAISNYIEAHNIDLLVMVNTSHSYLEDMLFRSKVDDISLHTNIPFLALQNIRRTS